MTTVAPASHTEARTVSGAIGRAVVGQQALDGDAVALGRTRSRGPRTRSPFRPSRRAAPRHRPGACVVDGDVAVSPADRAATPAVAAAQAAVAVLTARHRACRRRPRCGRFLDVDVDELTPPLALIALGRLQAQSPEPPHPDPGPDPETVDSAIPSSSAISGPVKRNRRNAAIASIRRSSVRLATNCGAPSCGPADRSLELARYPATHFPHVSSGWSPQPRPRP